MRAARAGRACGWRIALLMTCAACAGGSRPASSPGTAMTFEEALAADSGSYDPAPRFQAVAEPDWARGTVTDASPSLRGTRWRLSSACVVQLGGAPDVLAARERPPLETWRLDTDGCPGQSGFWQQAGGRVYFWMGLAGGWSVEYYGTRDGGSDSTLPARRYALRRTAPRHWRVERASMTSMVLRRVADGAPPRVRRTWEVTRALRAVGEPEWATRPGAGRARSIAGTRWHDAGGCTLIFGTTILARATRTQRLTRLLGSVACDSLRGSWQQTGKRVFWRVTFDSTSAAETYADLAGDSVMHARYFELRRTNPREPWQATWVPSAATTLTRVRR